MTIREESHDAQSHDPAALFAKWFRVRGFRGTFLCRQSARPGADVQLAGAMLRLALPPVETIDVPACP
jgi:hypothetical protein